MVALKWDVMCGNGTRITTTNTTLTKFSTIKTTATTTLFLPFTTSITANHTASSFRRFSTELLVTKLPPNKSKVLNSAPKTSGSFRIFNENSTSDNNSNHHKLSKEKHNYYIDTMTAAPKTSGSFRIFNENSTNDNNSNHHKLSKEKHNYYIDTMTAEDSPQINNNHLHHHNLSKENYSYYIPRLNHNHKLSKENYSYYIDTMIPEDSPQLKVLLMDKNARMPSRGSGGAAGYDLYSAEDTKILARGKALIKTGLAIQVPEGAYGRIAPRSSLASINSIDCGAGVIDADYRGEVKILLFNFGDQDFEVKTGDRIAQLIVERIYTPKIVRVDELDDTSRGSKGFGSTGFR
ncbi:3668_t:CDS:2 [Ambispora gerdemannii]|uniref:Deoxyuridine 5'-triphosphate nucleotidohydrolase n=1 Tax=Ambispora gerdemannii TaxID=144530 RepID=A0A9N8ZC99_9GLOM|nr:3668_t:CDS:2 [Ambispora gerdemannii]